jgi:hypothetical protein
MVGGAAVSPAARINLEDVRNLGIKDFDYQSSPAI